MKIAFGVHGVVARVVLCSIFFDAFVPLSPFVSSDFLIPARTLEALLGGGMILFALAQYISTPLQQWFGVHSVHAASAMFVGIFGYALTQTHQISYFVTILWLVFAFNGIGASAGRVLLRDASHHVGFQRLTANLQATSQVAAIVAPMGLTWMAASMGWRAPLRDLAAALVLISLGLSWHAATSRGRESRRALASYRAAGLLRDHRFVCAVAVVVAVQGPFTVLMLAKPGILLNGYAIALGRVGLLLSIIAAAAVLGFVGSGLLAPFVPESRRLCLGVVLQGISTALLALCAWLPAPAACFVAACFAAAWALGLLLPLAQAIALDRSQSERPAASGLFGLLTAIGTGAVVLVGSTVAADPLAAAAASEGTGFVGSLMLALVWRGADAQARRATDV